MTSLTVACVQMNAQADMQANLVIAEGFIRDAVAGGARFVALPENAVCMQESGAGLHPDPAPALTRFSHLARELDLWLLIGSIHAPAPNGKSWNRAVLFEPTGDIAAHYDKIHRFDVTLRNGETYSESARIEGGEEAVLAKTPWATLGLTICYDLRFPALYRTLAQAGANILTVPAAFTYTTGIAHWHTLLRARAIENGAFVIAPAQCGIHPGKRRTYGHSLIIDPWGEILAEGSETEPGIILATLDLGRIAEVRGMIPSLGHDRKFKVRK